MGKKNKLIIVVLVISIGVWNILSEVKASNYFVRNELLVVKKQIFEYKKWIKVNPKPYKIDFIIDGAD